MSDPIRTRNGVVFKIRYRVPAADGKWKHRRETLHGLAGKKAARAVLEERIKSVSNNPPTQQASEMTLREFIEAFWKPALDRKRVKPSTIDGYDSVLDRHLLPQLGDLGIADIAPLHVEEIVQKKTSEGLSVKTIRNMLTVLRGIFTLAVEQDVIPRSPVRRSQMPESEKTEKRVWTPDEVRKIIDAAPVAFKALFALVALTGIRLGELLALQWKHVDFEAGLFRITQSIWRGRLVSPKTTGSTRVINLGPVLIEILKAHLQASQHCGQEDFIFCKSDGSPLHPDVMRKDVLYPILDGLGIKRIPRESGFHAFRHSAGSIINNETGNLKLAQALLGHSNLSTTADVYTHSDRS